MSSKLFWGAITASRDWCEVNYEILPFIAEFWNTISNIAYIFAGMNVLVYYLRFKKQLPLSYLIIPLTIIGLGIFSAAYHATLLYWPQKSDQLFCIFPFIGLFSILPMDPTQNLSILPSIANIVAHMSFATIILFYITMISIVLFEIYMLILVIYTFYKGYYAIRNHKNKNSYYQMKIHSRLCIIAFICGVTVWSLERLMCNELRKLDQFNSMFLFNPQLHSWWHLFTALGFHEAAFIVMFENLSKHNNLNPKLIELINSDTNNWLKALFGRWTVGIKAVEKLN